jgi:putative endonuclease
MTSGKNGTLYIGVTSDLLKRVFEHKNNLVDSFTQKYEVHNLIYFEVTSDVHAALEREKRLKHWKREWKINLIEKENPNWEDLYLKLTDGSSPAQG